MVTTFGIHTNRGQSGGRRTSKKTLEKGNAICRMYCKLKSESTQQGNEGHRVIELTRKSINIILMKMISFVKSNKIRRFHEKNRQIEDLFTKSSF